MLGSALSCVPYATSRHSLPERNEVIFINGPVCLGLTEDMRESKTISRVELEEIAGSSLVRDVLKRS